MKDLYNSASIHEVAPPTAGYAALYIRTACTEAEAVAKQLHTCTTAANQLGLTVLPEDIFVDEGVSGLTTERPGLSQLIRQVCAGDPHFSTLLIDDYNRISRSTSHLMDVLALLERQTVAVHLADYKLSGHLAWQDYVALLNECCL